jgi:RNase P protein component
VASTACMSLHRVPGIAAEIGELSMTTWPEVGAPSTEYFLGKPLNQVVLAVPKRLLARAVDRNRVRRIARERYRRLRVNETGSWVWMLRLRALPAGYVNASQSARRQCWHAEIDRLFDRAFRAGLLIGQPRQPSDAKGARS